MWHCIVHCILIVWYVCVCILCWNARCGSECTHLVSVCVEIRMPPHALSPNILHTHACATHWTFLFAEHIHFYRPLLHGVSQHTPDSPCISGRYLLECWQTLLHRWLVQYCSPYCCSFGPHVVLPEVDIVTGTPGRLDDLISTGHLDLSNVCW